MKEPLSVARSRATQIQPPSPPTRATALSHPTAAIRVDCGCSGMMGKLHFNTIKEVAIEFTIGGVNKNGISVARRLAEFEHMDAYSRNQ